MTTNPYRVFGPSLPPMLGRASLVQRIERHILKPSPDHISVVGPAHFGKSVLLSHLAATHRSESSHYSTTVHIDLRRSTPTSDRLFKRRFAEDLQAALRPLRPEIAEYLDLEDEGIHELLDLVFTDLEKEGVRILMVMDGFDHVLAGTGFTRNLWDQLRSLAQKSSLRLVTGSRRPLRELCKTEESRTSDFWEIFYDTPIQVAAFGDADWEPLLQPLIASGRPLDSSARKEVANWTGGVPVLACALLQQLWDRGKAGTGISKPEVDEAAAAILKDRRELLAELWDDCDVELRADLGTLATADVPLTELSDARRRAVVERGYGHVSGNRLRSSCRLMQRHASGQAPSIADLTRLFGTPEGFEANVRSLLELRLGQVVGTTVDRDLRDFVSGAVRDMAPNPERAITWVRSIANRALALIWDAELPPDRTLPADWLNEWRHAGVNFSEDRGRLPRSYGAQCNILRLVTGSDRTPRQSRYVTKRTYLLVDHLQSVGDFGQHRQDFPETEITTGFAAAVVLAAISLVESLTGDLGRERELDNVV